MEQDLFFLRQAIQLAFDGMNQNAGGPFGALIVKEGEIIGQGFNQVTSTNDPTAHAEIVAIRRACQHLQSYQLDGCTLYASCEPCPMCLGAIYWARPARVVYAASHQDAAALAGFDDQFIYQEIALPPERRKIRMVQQIREEGLVPFFKWKLKQDREEY